ncbi:MAG: zinc ribbon domain-containing protein [Pyrinomonadaceae bacterium]|nr:zinc ribbon domain-containing protein [Pyrinomonadaceae bacterium]
MPIGTEYLETVFCPFCGQTNAEKAKFCKDCGGKIKTLKGRCQGCRAQLRDGARFCSKCGIKVET